MLSDVDIYRAAHLMMHEHGNSAELEAARCADRMLGRGDRDELLTWFRIMPDDRRDAPGPHGLTTLTGWRAATRMGAQCMTKWRVLSPSVQLIVDPASGARGIIRETRADGAYRFHWSIIPPEEPLLEGWNAGLHCVNRRPNAERVGGLVKGSDRHLALIEA